MNGLKQIGRMSVDLSKIESLAKKSHSTCKGVGVIGRKSGTSDVILCQCVHRKLKAMGVDYRNQKQITSAIGVDILPEVKR